MPNGYLFFGPFFTLSPQAKPAGYEEKDLSGPAGQISPASLLSLQKIYKAVSQIKGTLFPPMRTPFRPQSTPGNRGFLGRLSGNAYIQLNNFARNSPATSGMEYSQASRFETRYIAQHVAEIVRR